jgi:hypothetical protein
MKVGLGILAAVAAVTVTVQSAHAAILVDFYTSADGASSSATSPAAASDFSTQLGGSLTTSQLSDVSNSSVLGIDLGAFGNNAYSGDGLTITGNGNSDNGYYGGTKLNDADIFDGSTPPIDTETVSGISLAPDTNYELFLVTKGIFGGTATYTLTYGGAMETSGALGDDSITSLSFNSGDVPLSSFTVVVDPTLAGDPLSPDYAGFGSFAIVQAVPEPTSLSLLCLGSVMTLRRRRRI